jgi:hypothetical protein
MGRRRQRGRSSKKWGQHHAAERARVSALYGGVDADVRQVFFNLPQAILDRVLADYKQQHGNSACGYAKQAYLKWKSGRVRMSGLVSERLLAIVPRYLDFGVKYDLLEKLCRRRDGTNLRVEITADMTAREAIGIVLRAIENASSAKLPDHIVQRLHWLAENDGKAAQILLRQVRAREYEFIVRAVQAELQRLLSISSEFAGRPVEMQAHRGINLPGARVQIVLNNCCKFGQTGRTTMPDEQQNQGNLAPQSADGSLVPVTSTSHNGELAPVQNPQNLLEEALKRMTPEKQAEVLGKAADEALRLQVKRAENEQDLETVSDKIDQAAQAARLAAENPKVNVNFETEHRSNQGDTRLKVSSKAGPFGCVAVLALVAGVAILGFVVCLT